MEKRRYILPKDSLEKERMYMLERGLRPSYRRAVVLHYMRGNRSHPTVDDIYTDLRGKLPSLSRTTVYNVLSFFVSHGVLKELITDEGKARYDFVERPHAHFRCLECGKIYDVFVDEKLFDMKEIDGHQITDTQIYFTGVCKECLAKKQKKAGNE